MAILRLALDWTPNVNHIGFFIAKELGYYQQQGIELEVLDPRTDNYTRTPGKKLELDLADFAIAPFETVISLNNKTNKVNARAVFALLQEDLSSIACLPGSGITAPRQLDGKTYASYKARYEDHIVRQMIRNDGGTGNLNISYPDKLGIWNTLLEQKADATWIFDNWEGVEAAGKGIALTRFRMQDFGIPYGYSPVLLTTKEKLDAHQELFTRFVQATKEGYLFVKENPAAAAQILHQWLTDYDRQHINLVQSITMTVSYFGDAATCGTMKAQRVTDFLQWLVANQLEEERILQQELYTNALHASGYSGG